jgi:hypothetical protein
MEMEPDHQVRDREQVEEEAWDEKAVGEGAEWVETVRVQDRWAHAFVPHAESGYRIRRAHPATP